MAFKTFLLVVLITVFGRGECNFRFSETKINMLVNETRTIELYVKDTPHLLIFITAEHWDLLKITPKAVKTPDVPNPMNVTYDVEIKAIAAGETGVFTEASVVSIEDVYLTVQVYKSEFVEILSMVMGWGYFLAWSLSFYPQVYENYKRKSVVGLNFDYMAINLTGYLCYTAFNLGLYYVPEIQQQYTARFPKSFISVFPNDIFFSVHGIILTVYTCLQCFWYERGDQRISWFGKAFHYATVVVLVVSIGLSVFDVLQWLDFLYICSYIKLSVTVCKYAPQAIMNYKRRSTSGWSIGNVLLDLAGGILSILQMFLNAYNYDKWVWLWENPTKLGLAVLTLVFDFIFMVQHYCLYEDESEVKGKNDDLEMDVREKMVILPAT